MSSVSEMRSRAADDDSLMMKTSQPLEESQQGPPPPADVPRSLCFPAPLLSSGFNPAWPVAPHRLFCPVLTVSSREPSLKLFPAPRMLWTGADGSGGAPPRLFWGPSDPRALPRCFTSVAPVQDRTNTSDSEHQRRYYTNIFIEMQEQDKNANRADSNGRGRRLQHSSGRVKKAKRCRKDLPLQDLAESALTEYSQVMDALGSKVTEGSEVRDEEDVCALFLNQLLDDSQSTAVPGFDLDYIDSLLSSDVLKDNPEPVAGGSDWTRSTGSEAPPSEVQGDFNGTDLLLSEDPMMENILAPFQDNVKDQTASQMFSEPLLENPEDQTDRNTSVRETDGNLKDETLYVDELDSVAQSSCFKLQNYKSHHAVFPHTLKPDPEPPETPADGGLENDGEENMAVGSKPEKYTNVGSEKDNNKMDLDIPDDSQRMRQNCNKQTNLREPPKMDQIEENNVNENKKHKRRHSSRKIALSVERTSSKLDDTDKKRVTTAKCQPGKTQVSTTKHEAGEHKTDLIKINVKRVELQNITLETSSAMEGKRASSRQQSKKIRGEHLEEEHERRRRLKTVRRVGKERMTKNERDGAKTYRRSEGGGLKKQRNPSVEQESEVRQRLRREARPKLSVKVTEKVDEMST